MAGFRPSSLRMSVMFSATSADFTMSEALEFWQLVVSGSFGDPRAETMVFS
jgi:hypothetical protein